MASAVPLPRSSGAAVRLLVVDDSQVVRSVFQRILDRQPGFDVAGTCSSVAEALTFLDRQTVDIVLLDIEMPGRSGLDALPEIVERARGAAVIVISSNLEKTGPRNIEALSLGACDTLPKPGGAGHSSNFAEALIDKISAIMAQRGGRAATIAPTLARPHHGGRRVKPGCIAIGASTGGILAIQQFLASLPGSIDCPILITQHLPANFIPYFVGQLAGRVTRQVKIGDPGQAMERLHIYVAPGEGHMGCARDSRCERIVRIDGEFAARYTPAVDPMISSVATTFGPSAIGVVLSGMGMDGLAGARDMRAHGGTMIVQDEDSSVVWGMPGGIAKAGLADAIMRPGDMGAYLFERSVAL